MKLFDERQCGFVLADVQRFTRNPTWLKVGHFQDQTIKLNFGSRHFQCNAFGLGGFGRPVQKLQLDIARRDALGVDRAPRVICDLQKQQFRAAGFQGYLRTQSQNKRFVETCRGRKTFLRLGDNTGQQHDSHQEFGFHGSRLNAEILIDMRK